MGNGFPRRDTYIALVLPMLLAACSQSAQPATAVTPTVAATVASAPVEVAAPPVADACAANAQVAVDFLNQYLRLLHDQEVAANPPDTYDWLKGNALVDASVASAYATFDAVDGDPILDAQDFPDTFQSGGCPETPDVVLAKGVGMDLDVRVKVASVAGQAKVVGVGRVNMPGTN